MSNRSLDPVDLRLLDLLQKNNRRALRDYAVDLGISTPTCLRRLRRLEAAGVIVRHAAIIDAARVGFAVTAFVEVSLVEASGVQMAAFERRMRRCPPVLQCSEVAGEVDYLLTVVARDMACFGEFTRQHLAEDNRIRAYRSLLVLKQVKSEFELPLRN